MNHKLTRHLVGLRCVVFLTLFGALTGCSVASSVQEFLHHSTTESCNAHAYLRTPLADYISTRFHKAAPVRIGVVPFTQQENFTTLRNGVTGVGFDIARRVQANLAATGVVPIVELLNREDWPGKKDEFFSGNFGGISQAREAGYDLVLLGVLDTLRSMTDLRAFAKVIDVSSGTTVWYGRLEVSTARDAWDDRRARFGFGDRNPTRSYFDELLDELARCVAEEAVRE